MILIMTLLGKSEYPWLHRCTGIINEFTTNLTYVLRGILLTDFTSFVVESRTACYDIKRKSKC